MADDSNLEIDGVVYDHRLSRSILILSQKYAISQKEAATVCTFFNGFMLIEYQAVADIFISNCKRMSLSPIAALNTGVHSYLMDSANHKSN